MSEAVAEVTEGPVFEDEFTRLAFEQLEGKIKERNSLVGTFNASKGDKLSLVEQLSEDSTDPQIVAAREARDQAIMALHALVQAEADQIIANASEGVEGLEAKIKELDTQITPGLTYLKKMGHATLVEHLPKRDRVKGSVGGGGRGGDRGRSGGGSAGKHQIGAAEISCRVAAPPLLAGNTPILFL